MLFVMPTLLSWVLQMLSGCGHYLLLTTKEPQGETTRVIGPFPSWGDAFRATTRALSHYDWCDIKFYFRKPKNAEAPPVVRRP